MSHIRDSHRERKPYEETAYDASRQEVLAHANIANARLLAVAISDQESGVRAAVMARRLNAKSHLLARAR